MKSQMVPIVCIAALALSVCVVCGGKVLVFPIDGSHWVNMNILIKELHSRGHTITVFRSSGSWYIKESSPHYSSITIDTPGGFDEAFLNELTSRLIQIQADGESSWTRLQVEWELMVKGAEMTQMEIEMLSKLLDDHKLTQSLKDAKYDLVLADPVEPSGAILAHYLNLPLVFNVRWTALGEGHFAIAPTPLSYVPMPMIELTDKMNFLERVLNVLFFAFYELQAEFILRPMYAPFTNKYLGPDVDYFQLIQGADIWLMRVDFVFEFPRPTMPNIVYMGGFQCKPAKPLPQDLEDFVQSSGEHGVIIMSLGTLVSELPKRIIEEMAAAFAQLPQKVIMRYTGEKPSTLGNNTLLVEWLPQNDLLGHSKTKVFVAHGGTNGVQEAIYHGVPILGVPLMFDQPDNLSKMRAKGAAKVMDIFSVNRDSFLQGLQEVLHEPSYRENMQRLSRLHRDQPMKPLDRAIFWIEFVMRHKGAAHLRTESYKMPWYTYHSVDVILFLLAVMTTFVATFVFGMKFLCTRICCKRKSKQE
ncbi:UDP-glucuronosyltransferase 2A3-like isoform X2 [Clupea harengus]|nr:UDP-glucuronosyltransferase 2A3-like isoform X2 [Clupea harengus]XP_042561068.1 UDP-glucuronosyltransferase 2A3-like isoform X2 [Clupea harengus]